MTEILKAIGAAIIAKVALPEFFKRFMAWLGEWIKKKYNPPPT